MTNGLSNNKCDRPAEPARLIVMLLMAAHLCLGPATARADTPPSQVITQQTAIGQPYLTVTANSEKWIDVGGFCKVVDVGSLSSLPPDAQGRQPDAIPIFDPGSTAQWENWRSVAPSHYGGALTSTTCCRPQTNVAMLCAAGTTQTPVNRDYGKLGETDQLSATCDDGHGATFIDTVSLSCSGDNGPDGQGSWQESGDSHVCSPNAWVGPCNATCPSGTGTQTVFDSCNNPQTTQSCSINCCTPVFSFSCNGPSFVRTDTTCGTGSVAVGACTLKTVSTQISCTPHADDCVPNDCGGITCFNDCNDDGDWSAGCTVDSTCTKEGPLFNSCASGITPPIPGPLCALESATCTSTEWVPL